jgi:colanic acid/amylovoran biosynthesis glycosyltransferase
LRIAYLVNRYPTASHSFIRREIHAVEATGTEVIRFSIRAVGASEVPDQRDRAEQLQTEALLQMGVARLMAKAVRVLVTHPLRSMRALKVAFAGNDRRMTSLIRRTAYFVEGAALAMRAKSHSIDHLHAHFGTNSAMVARLASILSGIPYSFTVHGPDEFDAPIQLDLKGKVADCAFCVAISSFGRSQLMRWSTYSDWSKIKLVRCGVDDSFLRCPRTMGVAAVPHICTVARLSAQKGIPLLLEAVAILKRAGEPCTLTIVGDGEMRTELEGLINSLELSEHVNLVGVAASDEIIEHLLDARAMVLPSFAEGLPVVIMEALALFRPVIVSAIAGTPELVNKHCGWLVSAGSVGELVEAIRAALNASPEDLDLMGEVGRARVSALHDSFANGGQLNELFRKAVETHE